MHDSLDDLKPAAVEAPLSTPSEMTTANGSIEVLQHSTPVRACSYIEYAERGVLCDSFYARQHYNDIARMCYTPVRPSVSLSETRVDQSKTVEARITKFSTYCSPIPLVFRQQVSSRNSEGFSQSGGVK